MEFGSGRQWQVDASESGHGERKGRKARRPRAGWTQTPRQNDAKILSLLPAEKTVPLSDWTFGFVDLQCAASLSLLVCAPSCLEASQKLLCP